MFLHTPTLQLMVGVITMAETPPLPSKPPRADKVVALGKHARIRAQWNCSACWHSAFATMPCGASMCLQARAVFCNAFVTMRPRNCCNPLCTYHVICYGLMCYAVHAVDGRLGRLGKHCVCDVCDLFFANKCVQCVCVACLHCLLCAHCVLTWLAT